MSTISTIPSHQNKSRCIPTKRKNKVVEMIHIPPIVSSFATSLNNSEKSIVTQSIIKPLNNEIDTLNTTKISQYYQSSTQVRHTNEKNLLYNDKLEEYHYRYHPCMIFTSLLHHPVVCILYRTLFYIEKNILINHKKEEKRK